MTDLAQKKTNDRKASGLTEKSIQEIRSLYGRAGMGWTPKSLARIFGTTEAAISAVVNRTGPYKD